MSGHQSNTEAKIIKNAQKKKEKGKSQIIHHEIFEWGGF